MLQTLAPAMQVKASEKFRPTLFIGSSSAGLPVAQALQENLSVYFDVEIWNQGAFDVGDFNLESLINTGRRTHFAVLVLTPDDLTTVDNMPRPSPRDNVIFEMGFFLGILGRKQAFIVHEAGSNLKLPTDIDGVTCAKYILPRNGNLTAALGPASNKIYKLAFSESPGSFITNDKERQKIIQVQVKNMLKTACTALAVPNSAENTKLRAFVFKKIGERLICKHFWATNQVEEVVDELKFDINAETQKQVAVVKAAIEKKVCASHITALPDDLEGVEGKVDKSLCFVLAAPILGPNGEVWGTVDFDASSETGEAILSHEMSGAILFDLGKHLYLILSGDYSHAGI